MPSIHPTAIISEEAEIAEEAEIGPGCVLTGRVTLGPRVRLIGNVYLSGPVTIGADSALYPFVCVGFEPQDFKFPLDSPTAGVRIGEGCILREYATVHSASNIEKPTTVGDRVFMMTNSHVAHDVAVGDDAVFVTGAVVGGHATIGDRVMLGGNSQVHQHTRIGRLAFTGGGVGVSNDLPPFCMAVEVNRLQGLNLVGLRRSGMPMEDINALRKAFVSFLRPSLQREELIEGLGPIAAESPAVNELLEFIRTAERPICSHRPRQGRVGKM